MNVNKADARPERSLTPLLTAQDSSDGDKIASPGQDEVARDSGVSGGMRSENEKEEEITWASLPHRGQLIVLTLSRLSEPLVQTSLQVGKWRIIHLDTY